MTILLCTSGSRPSNTRIAHFETISLVFISGKLGQRTWSKSSKSLVANFFIPEALFANFQMVSWPKVGIRQYLLKF